MSVKLSYCGIACGYCPAYRKGKCEGCEAHAENCEFIKCLKSRNEENCLLCNAFPCDLHKKGFRWEGVGRWRMFSDEFLNFVENL